MRVKDRDGRVHEVEVGEAQRLIESGEAQPVIEPPVHRAVDTTSRRVRTAEKRARG